MSKEISVQMYNQTKRELGYYKNKLKLRDQEWKDWLVSEADRHKGTALGDAIEKTMNHLFMHKNLFT